MIESHDTSGVNGPEPAINDPAQYEIVSEAAKEALACYIGLAMRAADEMGPGSSYTMKHDFERATGIYVSNGAFKGAMLAAGYEPVDWDELNWTFRVRPAASDEQLYHHMHGDGVGHYPLPEDDPKGLQRLAALVDKARGKAI